MSKILPRGIRNCNPGNIERGTDRWLGMSADQSSDPRFIVFDTPEYGIRAVMRLLINYQERHGLWTLREMLNRWAPPVGKDEKGKAYTQNTSGYIQHVSRLTGFDPDERIDILDRYVCVSVARAIIRHENGSPEPFGKPEFWYDDATYDRAAVMAGFQAESKPLTHSRTIGGTIIGGGAAVAGAIYESAGEVMQSAQQAVTPLIPFLDGDIVRMAIYGLIAAGFGAIVYARVDDWRRKIR